MLLRSPAEAIRWLCMLFTVTLTSLADATGFLHMSPRSLEHVAQPIRATIICRSRLLGIHTLTLGSRLPAILTARCTDVLAHH
jgi:hypothetical protein